MDQKIKKKRRLSLPDIRNVNDEHTLIEKKSFFQLMQQSIWTIQVLNQRHKTNISLAFFFVQFRLIPSHQERRRIFLASRNYDLGSSIKDDVTFLCMIAPKNENEILGIASRLLKYCPPNTKIGITLFPNDSDSTSVQTFIDYAEQAIENAPKHQDICFYATGLEERSKKYLDETISLKKDLNSAAFDFYYQPKYNAQHTIEGAEALLRRFSGQKTLAIPETIEMAEKTGLIIRIGEEALQRNVERMKTCFENHIIPPTLSINLSPHQLTHKWYSFCDFARKFAFASSYIELEITESALATNKQIKSSIDELKEMGFCLAVDDFGIKESSLSKIAIYPIDVIKIDKSFVDGLHKREKADIAIIKAIISISKDLGIKTVAEGVEHQEQAEELFDMGCDLIQGYYYSRPLSYDQYYALLLKDHSKDHSM